MLYPKGSGVAGNPIVIDAYGTGNLPLINGQGKYYNVLKNDRVDAAVYLNNSSYVTIKNLEVTNEIPDTLQHTIPYDFSSVADRSGIHVDGSVAGTLTGITISNCVVHHVASNGNATEHARMAGINVWARSWNTSFTNVLIEQNQIYTTGSAGINVNAESYAGAATGVVIQNNYLSDIGGDGILVNACTAPLVQYNVVAGSHYRSTLACVAIWAFQSTNALFQYNEAYNTQTTNDGQSFDCDYKSTGTTFQYNYGHDNVGGFMLICNEGSNANDGSIVRYNIGQNNGSKVFTLWNKITNSKIYNNVIYVPSGTSYPMIWSGTNCGMYPDNTQFYNNILYNLGSCGYTLAGLTNTVFDYNIFYGNHHSSEPADAHKLTADPLFVSPGGAGVGLSSCDSYKIRAGSPAIGSGMVIGNNGGKDFWGNAVSDTAAPNRGAYNGVPVGTTTTTTTTPAPTTTATTPSTTAGALSNVASGKTATVSNIRNGSNLAKITDGVKNSTSQRQDLPTGEQWVTVDLGQTYNVGRLDMYYETHPPSYTIYPSTDGSTWTQRKDAPAASTMSGYPGLLSDTFTAASCRYVKIAFHATASQYGYGVCEMEVYYQ